MSVKINDNSSNERRFDSEVSPKRAMEMRYAELHAGVESVHNVVYRVFPEIFTPPVAPPIEVVVVEPIQPVANQQTDSSFPTDQQSRLAAIREDIREIAS